MSKRKPRTGFCIYCCQEGILSRDHIPPKTLFASPRPSNLITVPCCEPCNVRASLDDEYFRLVFTTQINTFPHQDACSNWESVKRSFDIPKKDAFKKSFLDSLHKMYLFSQKGEFIAETGKFNIDTHRVKRVIERIVKGLFYHENKIRLTDNYEVLILTPIDMNNLPGETINFLKADIFPLFQSVHPIILGREVFIYKVVYNEIDDNQSVWLLLFYRAVVFLVWILPKHTDPNT